MAKPAVGRLVVNEIYTWQAGPPLSCGNVLYYGGDLHLQPGRVDGATSDTTRFNTASAQQLASNVRTFPTQLNSLRADGINTLNASALKQFHISEQRFLQIRFEVFKAVNHPKFAAPNLSPTSSAFGSITASTINPRQVQSRRA
jgi:hypothetical protein